MPNSAHARISTVVPLSSQSSRRTELEFLPAALEVLETPASPVGRAVSALIVAFLAGAIAWACLGHVEIIAVAPGKIVPTGRTKAVQPLEAGIVSAIHVQDGDRVKAGQVLIELHSTIVNAERLRTAHDLLKAQLDTARLLALREAGGSSDLHFVAPPQASEAEVSKAQAAMLAQASEQEQKLAALDKQIDQKRAEMEEIEASIAKVQASLPLVKEEAGVREKAMKIEFGNKIAYLEAQTKLVDQQNELTVQQRHANGTAAAREALERQRDQARAEYTHKILSDLSEAEQKVAELTQDLVKADQKIEERRLRAAVDGTVQQLAVHTLGGVVTPAQQIMLIVPEDSHLEIEAMVSNDDIGFVRQGQAAEIKVGTFDFTRYGLLHGRVLNVSDDAVVEDSAAKVNSANSPKSPDTSNGSGDPQRQRLGYQARVSLDRMKMQIEDKLVNLEPGMGVTVEIKTGSRRVIEYLLSPLLRYRHESLRER
ncbi:HlyD family type I secretion periplasmic adaptor subunit [Bradyrhizobium sp.]|uniref:HlyD family type I secretion periplasmic adaptor subunit n=1 Tax=Bradyrhizobium sp. TaxID=376 RepID=UPI001ED01801|nr:HlyD family type I secretion periplasmic adaptor subunit [Bradyrhizobium sp.]MBV8923701.1 HlyD family type I secretion periplasmic adaptor subunit [Bradyrhizobium sp.]MBV9981761.1 HlyD family type I secretion periplasmic adaptor subunit [Bradyrhizobium sp.]